MRKLNNRVTWKGKEVVEQVQKNVADAYMEFGLEVEGAAKNELQKGHGVVQGTLRRSIHVADPGYDWSQDDVPEGEKGPERGGRQVNPLVVFGRVLLLIGSGLHYSLPVHQGHHGFTGYHYLTNGLRKVKDKLPNILAKHRMKK